MITVREMFKADAQLWNSFVNSIESSYYTHLFEWKYVYEESYNLKTLYLGGFDGTDLVSVLPVVELKYLFKKPTAFSLPYLNYAGFLTRPGYDTEEINKFFYNYLEKCGIKSIELRSLNPINENTNTNEFTLLLSLEGNEEFLWSKFNAKVRNQIRKANKSNLETHWGINQLDEFYKVYAENITRLGTPVHSFNFFSNICKYFEGRVDILTVKLSQKTIASMLLFKYNKSICDPWASSLNRYLEFCPNMLMHWEAIRFGLLNDYKIFDFGRSHIDSGTYKFKKQWNAHPVKLYNVFFSNGIYKNISTVEKYRSSNARLFAGYWKKLPMAVSKRLGPVLRKYIP